MLLSSSQPSRRVSTDSDASLKEIQKQSADNRPAQYTLWRYPSLAVEHLHLQKKEATATTNDTTEDHNVLGSNAEQDFHDHVAAGVAAGLSAEEFAPRVFAGIEADRFWILPQPEFKPLYQMRADTVLNETPPPSADDVLALYSALSGRD